MEAQSRQSSTRWSPTSDQIRILKELYYNNGIRSPSAEQIQRISARLRQYGKIEGKNVFYWFQNHKARERQKKRFTSDTNNHVPTMQLQKPHHTTTNAVAPSPLHSKYPNISPTGVSLAPSSSSAEMVTVGGQIGNCGYGYGSLPMEKSFMDCSISAGGSSGYIGSGINQNLGLVGVDPAYSSAYTNFFGKIRPTEETIEEEQEAEIETLPLFPIQGENIHDCCNLKSNSSNYDIVGGCYYQAHEDGFKNGSLELSLNSYARRSPDFA